jgi:hypothetical protein
MSFNATVANGTITLATPLAPGASLSSRGLFVAALNQTRLLNQWLCHADARQVCDLPESP